MSQSFIPEYKIHVLYFFKRLNCIFTIYVHHPKYRIPRIDFFLIMAHSILITITKLDVPISLVTLVLMQKLLEQFIFIYLLEVSFIFIYLLEVS